MQQCLNYPSSEHKESTIKEWEENRGQSVSNQLKSDGGLIRTLKLRATTDR